MTDDREKILSRIHKCMKLSKSSEPHEAAAALRQAQKMIQAHGVSDAELMGIELTSVLVITPAPAMRKCPLGFAHLVSIVSMAFGVEATMEGVPHPKTGKWMLAFRYFGVGGRPQLAAYAHDVMWRQLWSSWNKYRHLFPELANVRGARMGFWLGWLDKVAQQVVDFGATPEEREQVQKYTKLFYEDKGGISEGKQNKMKVSGLTAAAGHAAAGDFSIHRPMEGAVEEEAPQLALSHN